MADDNDNNSSEKENLSSNSNYVRKKNLIPGLDNDHLIIGMIGLLGAAVAAPHIKNAIDNLVQQYKPQLQVPNNGMQQQPVYLPPNTPQQPTQVNVTQEVPHEHEHNHAEEALAENERALRDQKAYDAALEKDQTTGASSFSMVPDRSTRVSTKNKNKGNYEAGSNISGSYS